MTSPPLDTLRKWREQAINSHNLTMADFFANKICSFSKDLEDLYWLAQIYYLGGHYTRIEKLLSNSEIYDSLKCVYLLALSLIKLDKFEESHSLLSKYEYFDPSLVEQQPVGQDEYENVKIESLLCFLCGVCFLKRSTPVRAKNCFVRALKVDVKCFEAYDRLMSLDMLTADEEQELFNSLNFERDCGPASDFIKTLYQTKLKKIGVIPEIQRSIEILEDQYDLKSNLDVVLTKAQVEFLAFRFENCLKLTREIIKKDEINQTALPIHISCLFVLEKKSDLMLYSHELSEKYPGEAATWFAVGVYYLAKQANVESRQHFSKALAIDPQFLPAWIAFGHSFALEEEKDTAISAYMTASKLVTGQHQPYMYLAMLHLKQGNLPLSRDEFMIAQGLCKFDPYLENEVGMYYYQNGEYEKALISFEKSIELLSEIQSTQSSYTGIYGKLWESAWNNSAHAYRKLGNYEKALENLFQILSINPTSTETFVSIAFVYHIQNEFDRALTYYHKALVLNDGHFFAGSMCRVCVQESVDGGFDFGFGGVVRGIVEGEEVGGDEDEGGKDVVEGLRKFSRGEVELRKKSGGDEIYDYRDFVKIVKNGNSSASGGSGSETKIGSDGGREIFSTPVQGSEVSSIRERLRSRGGHDLVQSQQQGGGGVRTRGNGGNGSGGSSGLGQGEGTPRRGRGRPRVGNVVDVPGMVEQEEEDDEMDMDID